MKYFLCPKCGHALGVPKKASIEHGICIKCRKDISIPVHSSHSLEESIKNGLLDSDDSLDVLTSIRADLDDQLTVNNKLLAEYLLDDISKRWRPIEIKQFLDEIINRISKGEIQIDETQESPVSNDSIVSLHVLNVMVSSQIDKLITQQLESGNQKRNAT